MAITPNFTVDEVEKIRILIAELDARLSEGDDVKPITLTAREKEILSLFAAGRNRPQIAIVCTISIRTVETHLANILGKLGADNARQAVIFAQNLNLLTIEEINQVLRSDLSGN